MFPGMLFATFMGAYFFNQLFALQAYSMANMLANLVLTIYATPLQVKSFH